MGGLSGLLILLTLSAVSVSAILLASICPGPGQFIITDVSIGADRDLINVTYMEVSHVTIISYRL